MNDSEIIKALKKTLIANSKLELFSKALNLIEQQQAEIERLIQENNALNGNTEKYIKECENRSQQIAEGYRKEIKSEAVREFAESLKRKSELVAPSVWAIPYRAVAVADIDRLLEGMGCNDG